MLMTSLHTTSPGRTSDERRPCKIGVRKAYKPRPELNSKAPHAHTSHSTKDCKCPRVTPDAHLREAHKSAWRAWDGGASELPRYTGPPTPAPIGKKIMVTVVFALCILKKHAFVCLFIFTTVGPHHEMNSGHKKCPLFAKLRKLMTKGK